MTARWHIYRHALPDQIDKWLCKKVGVRATKSKHPIIVLMPGDKIASDLILKMREFQRDQT